MLEIEEILEFLKSESVKIDKDSYHYKTLYTIQRNYFSTVVFHHYNRQDCVYVNDRKLDTVAEVITEADKIF